MKRAILTLVALAAAVTTALPPATATSATLTVVAPEAGTAMQIVLPGVGWPGRRQAALTFDDGPSAYTGRMLDVLARKGARATFFVVGRAVDGRRATVARAYRNGNSVQNHSWSHPSLTSLSNAGIRSQLTSTNNAVARATGRRPACFRPPYGSTNARVRQVASGVGLRQVLWTTAVADYTGLSSAAIARQALRNADGRPLVIAMHDGGGPRGNTVAALPAIIDGLRARGYTLVTLCR